MEEKESVMILGSGRIANRLRKLFEEKGMSVTEVLSEEFKERKETIVEESGMDYACEKLIEKGINQTSAVCIVDYEDAVNIYLLMAVLAVNESLPIYASFFNESLVSELALKHRNVKLFNPADIVGKLFVESVPKSMSKYQEVKTLKTYTDNPRDSLIFLLLFGFVWLIFSGALFFHITESVDWLRSFYLVVTVITSVNFNDAELMNYNWIVEIMRIGLMLATYAYVLFALAFIVDYIVRRRIEIFTFGRRRYNKRGHVIVCGLGRVGYAIVHNLVAKGEDVLIIESDPDNKYLPAVRSYKASVLIGDATLQHYLIDAGIGSAKALISAIDGDYINLEIGLNARAENKNIRLLLRIFDQLTAQEMKKRFNIHFVFSKSYATAKVICDNICRSLNKTVVFATIKK